MTVGRTGQYNPNEAPVYKPPCTADDPSEFGCAELVQAMNYVVCLPSTKRDGAACSLAPKDEPLPSDINPHSVDENCIPVSPVITKITPNQIGGTETLTGPVLVPALFSTMIVDDMTLRGRTS